MAFKIHIRVGFPGLFCFHPRAGPFHAFPFVLATQRYSLKHPHLEIWWGAEFTKTLKIFRLDPNGERLQYLHFDPIKHHSKINLVKMQWFLGGGHLQCICMYIIYIHICIDGSYPWILSFWNILIKLGLRLFKSRGLLGLLGFFVNLLRGPLAKDDNNSSFGRIFPCHCGKKTKGSPQFFPA